VNNPYDTLNQPDPVNSERWYSMTPQELEQQKVILLERYNAVQTLISSGGGPTYVMLATALQHSMDLIDEIIANTQKQINEKNKNKHIHR
jgi:homoserine kinase